MSKQTRAWAVVDIVGQVRAVGMSQLEAWENAGRNEQYPAGWLELRKDYRCIRVTITPREGGTEMNDNIEVLRGLVAKWREHAALYECELEQDIAGTLDRCADELDAALAAMGGQGEVLLTNPHTGTPRDYRDVESDPNGILIHKAGEPLQAAPRQPEARVGGEVSYAECCDTPAYCSSVRQCTAKDTPPPSAVPEWRPIESAPRDGTSVLWGAAGKVPQQGHWANGPVFSSEWDEDVGYLHPSYAPTHWMPLPAAPEPGEVKNG